MRTILTVTVLIILLLTWFNYNNKQINKALLDTKPIGYTIYE